ncbi:hypothetical protein GCM10009639_30090 [Kitasatospora putterlickiae]|uniref:Uncharacterized protein n=1 Tax=Kitasatospora putterlickiae TaxID=221725 RepID=A0ABN1Y1D0_9ACTN
MNRTPTTAHNTILTIRNPSRRRTTALWEFGRPVPVPGSGAKETAERVAVAVTSGLLPGRVPVPVPGEGGA